MIQKLFGQFVMPDIQLLTFQDQIFEKSNIGDDTFYETSPRVAETSDTSSDDIFRGPYPWHTATPQQLQRHIISAHFQARTLENLGVPRYDIEVAHYRGLSLQNVIEAVYEKLEQSDAHIQTEIEDHKIGYKFRVYDYKVVLVKTLLFIQNLRKTPIDWERVFQIFPEAKTITLDIKADAKDASFLESVAPFLPYSIRSLYGR